MGTSKSQSDVSNRDFVSIRYEIEKLAQFHAVEVPVKYGDGEERIKKMIPLVELETILSEVGKGITIKALKQEPKIGHWITIREESEGIYL